MSRSRTLLCATAALVVLGAAFAVAQLETPTDAPSGRWREARGLPPTEEMTEDQRREVERLRSIGYLTGSRPARSAGGVTIHDPGSASQGYNFYTSGHMPGAVLMDMDGTVLHVWQRDFEDIWPEYPRDQYDENMEYWRTAELLPNGDVLAIFEGVGIVRLDRDSGVVWSHLGGEHHDFEILPDGSIYVLTRDIRINPRINPENPILEDYLSVLDPEGNELRRISMVDALGNSRYINYLPGMTPKGDIFHTNGLDVLDGHAAARVPAFEEGNVLLSMRKLNLLCVLDMDTELMDWAVTGMWLAQHDPIELDSGNVLVFDNNGYYGGSQVIEFDPATQRFEWVYHAEEPIDFYSQQCGAARRLPNGNTLITESDNGRAFEVTEDGAVVWEFVNPERAGDEGQYVATLFEMVRVPEGFPMEWLRSSARN
ncbi:MAG: hypothetical protein GF405_02065 [Candidatus Eisenbacteria bacterium]|nr:hypothetical protein [Candidatus Eisenbacteria bacterium]